MQNPRILVPSYSLYGLTLNSDFPFTLVQPRAEERTADLDFTLAAEPPVELDWQQIAPIYEVYSGAAGTFKSFAIYPLTDGGEVLRFNDAIDFYLWRERIVCYVSNPAEGYLVETLLMGVVFAYWMEQRGNAVLHAATIVTSAGAVAFVAPSGSGKSSLLASFTEEGYPILGDDFLPIYSQDGHMIAAPSYPQIRLCNDSALWFLDHSENSATFTSEVTKRIVAVGGTSWGSFCDCPQPLTALYLLQRENPASHGTSVEIEVVNHAEALFMLLSRCYVSHLVPDISRQRRRLRLLTPLVEKVPVRRLSYPSGYEYLPRVRQAILDGMTQSVASL